MKKARALAIAGDDQKGYSLHNARGGVAVGEPVAGPFATRAEAETARFERMRPAPPKPVREGRAPRDHAPPALARSNVK